VRAFFQPKVFCPVFLSVLLSVGLLAVVPAQAAPLPERAPVTPAVEEIRLGSLADPAGPSTVEPGTQNGPEHRGQPALRLVRTDLAQFSSVGVTWAADPAVRDVRVSVRTQSLAGDWSQWSLLEAENDGAAPTTDVASRGGTAPYWTGLSTGIELEVLPVEGRPTDVRLTLIDPLTMAADAAPVATPSTAVEGYPPMPAIYSRASWGADEELMNWTPSYADTLVAATIHHTADSNSYDSGDVPGMLRSIYYYHSVTRGWGDIGYNAIVDKFGRIWEGRFGGLATTVIGAHAGGFNTGTFGVSVIGNYDLVQVPEVAMDAVASVVSWKLSLFGLDPLATTRLTSVGGDGTTSKYPPGTTVTVPVVFGHQEVGDTACPGQNFWPRMGELRTRIDAKTTSYPTSFVELSGHGYGHGRGMGQWGAYGYATIYDWLHPKILKHYYRNTNLGSQANSLITVRLLYQDSRALVVTSGRDFRVDDVLIAGGQAARIELRSDGQFTITPKSGCAGSDRTPLVRRTSKVVSTVANPGNDQSAMLAVCTSTGTNQYRGTLSLASSEGSARTVNSVLMEDYLRSVVPAESPASWADSGGAPALRAQAVAARSYAYSENRYSYAKTCDTTSCQVYSGAGRNRVSQEDYRTDDAIRVTANEVLRFSSGSIARAEFSSSTGGYTAGGTFPAYPDDGDVASPYHDWDTSISVSSIESAYGIGTLQSVQVLTRNGLGEDGGRVLTMRVIGSARSVDLTGDEFRQDWGLRSDWFTIAQPPPPPPPPPPPGPLHWYLRNSNSTGPSDGSFPFGSAGDQALSCDWNGDGYDSIGVFRSGTFYLRNSNSRGSHHISFRFGNASDIALCGDFDNNGVDTVGVFRNGALYLRNSNSGGPHDITSFYGQSGDLPVMGDWNGDGYDTIGILRGANWHLSDSNRTPVTSYSFAYGQRGDQPLAGDWNGDGTAGVGVRRGVTFYLKNSPGPGAHNARADFGNPSDRGVAGDWDRNGTDTIGVARGF